MARSPSRYADWDRAKSEADRLTEEYTIPPVPVLEIAEHNGVDVKFVEFDKYADEISGFCDFSEAKIYVNAEDILSRQMFTIAHELGHWILHRDIFLADPESYPVMPRFTNPDASDPLEEEANHFAANLLVPNRLLRPIIDLPISSLADLFAVSRIMMEYRVKNVKQVA
ncbi:MAG: ImmA/IrrE family metallo-endopeptidase [Rhodobiaceae bacterium]|nr:ImmA/IrrE family metallo-endopeptidase [Rhodobiaceae bacterium]